MYWFDISTPNNRDDARPYGLVIGWRVLLDTICVVVIIRTDVNN